MLEDNIRVPECSLRGLFMNILFSTGGGEKDTLLETTLNFRFSNDRCKEEDSIEEVVDLRHVKKFHPQEFYSTQVFKELR